MNFENLSVSRVIIHEVFARQERERVQPRYGEHLIELDAPALEALRERIIEAMGKASHSMEMGLAMTGPGSLFSVVSSLVDADNRLFIHGSREVADKLADAQTTRNIPGGVLVVISGSVGTPARRIICIIKAEPHSGFARHIQDEKLSLTFLKDLILTPQAKLYKIGVFVENGDGIAAGSALTWRAFVYDHTITAGNRGSAAQYFYETFLGCKFLESDARRTREFYGLTKDFIRGLNVPEEEKVGFYTALATYLKVDQRPTVEVTDFAQSYFKEPAIRDAYAQYMESKSFPLTAIHKDLAEIGTSLKQRRVTFSNDVRLSAPPEKFEAMIRMRVIAGEADASGQIPQWTEIIVRDRIREQE